MIAYDIKCKDGFRYGSPNMDSAYNIIELDSPQEVGDIINGCWLIINCGDLCKFNKGQYARAINLTYFDIVATDKDYENDSRLEKYGTEIKIHDGKDVLVNRYIVLM